MTTTRRLAAILAADVAGYSAAMERDEEGTAAAVRALRREVIEPKLAEHQGRLIKTTGDGFLAEFASPIAALKCALDIQQRPDEGGGLRLRIGLNLGDVIIEEGGDLLGEGVNIAARLESLAEPGGILVSDKIVREVEGKVEASFEDRGEQQVKNISKPVRAYAIWVGNQASTAMPEPDKPLPLPDKPSIAVLPFQNMSGDPEQEYFADGIVEDIITALSRFRELFVIARNSSFTYKGRAVDIKQIGRELGVRYVLEGSVRKAGGRVRITGQLIDATTNNHLWADKFDGAMDDVFELQDRVTAAVVQMINPAIEETETERTSSKPTERLDSYDCFLRGMALIHQYEFSDRARELFYKATQLDPNYATAYAMQSCVIVNQQATFGAKLSVERENEALRLADVAAKLAGSDAFALARSAETFAILGNSYDRATSMVDRAVSLNPNLAIAWHARGWIAVLCCDGARAIESFNASAQFSPRDRAKISAMIGKSYAYWILGQYEEGFALAKSALEFGATALSLTTYIANAVAVARLVEAKEAVKTLHSVAPEYTLSSVPGRYRLRDTRLVDKLVEHLERAGLS